MKMNSKVISATEFKAKCLKILDELDSRGVVISKRGRPIARVTPILASDHEKLICSMKGEIAIKGNLFSTGAKWNAQS